MCTPIVVSRIFRSIPLMVVWNCWENANHRLISMVALVWMLVGSAPLQSHEQSHLDYRKEKHCKCKINECFHTIFIFLVVFWKFVLQARVLYDFRSQIQLFLIFIKKSIPNKIWSYIFDLRDKATFKHSTIYWTNAAILIEPFSSLGF